MEKEEKEANKHKELKLIAKSPNWLDLPNPIATNIILEHLEIADCVRFSAVCKEWLLIKKEHGIRYYPYPPPSPLPFPWQRCIKTSYLNYGNKKSYSNKQNSYFYIPNKHKLYNIPYYRTRKTVQSTYCNHGWLLLLSMVDNFTWCLCIFNPITHVQIELPPLTLKEDLFPKLGSMFISSTPSDPDCTVVIMCNEYYFCRLNDNSGWKMIDYSDMVAYRIAVFNNKIYRVSKYCDRILVVDTLLPNPVEQLFEMDRKILIYQQCETMDLVNILGGLVIVRIQLCGPGKLCYKLYRANFSTSKWERMRSLGDHALFYSNESSFSLPAIDVGCKKNTIYSTRFFETVTWTAFDLSTKEFTEGPPFLVSRDFYGKNPERRSWFLPTLDYFNAGKTTGA